MQFFFYLWVHVTEKRQNTFIFQIKFSKNIPNFLSNLVIVFLANIRLLQ